MTKALAAALALALAVAAFIFIGRKADTPPPPPPPYVETRWLFGTQVTVTLAGLSPEAAKNASAKAFAPMEAVDGAFARRAGTLLDALNRAGSLAVSPELFGVAKRALFWAGETGGAFDPTVGALVDLWAVESGPHKPPERQEIEKTLGRTGWRKVSLDEGSLRIETGATLLELGGIAKGFALDEAAAALKASGARDFIVDAGGDLVLSGSKNGSPWRVGVRDPRSGTALSRVLFPASGAIVTSGDYERFFEWEGVSYSHIIDPATGFPAQGVRSATVWAENAMDADALATAVCVLGAEKGLALVAAHPPSEAYVIYASGVSRETPGFAKVAPEAASPHYSRTP